MVRWSVVCERGLRGGRRRPDAILRSLPMWRTYVICILIGLLLVSTGSNVLLMRQVLAVQSDTDRLRSRLTAAESAQNSLQQQLDQLKVATPAARSTPAAVPTVAVGGPDRALLQQIEDDVSGLRGLQPKNDVTL